MHVMEQGLLVLVIAGAVGFVGGVALSLTLCRRLFHAMDAEAATKFRAEAEAAEYRALELKRMNDDLGERCRRSEQRLADYERRREEERKEKETSNRTILERTETWLRGGPIVPREPESRPDRFEVEGGPRPHPFDTGVTETPIAPDDIGRALRHRDEREAMMAREAQAAVAEVLRDMPAEERERLESLAATQETTAAELLYQQARDLYHAQVAGEAAKFKAGDPQTSQNVLAALLGSPRRPEPEVAAEPTDGLVDRPVEAKKAEADDKASTFNDVGYVD